MKYQIVGDSDCPIVKAFLAQGEGMRLERGAMVYMQDVQIQGRMNARSEGIGGILGAIGRKLTSGESMFITEAYGTGMNGEIGIAPAVPGRIVCLPVGQTQYRLNTGAYLASDMGVNYRMVAQNVGQTFFGGTGGLFVMETDGSGDLLVNAFGDLLELTVTPDRPLTIDNLHVVAWDYRLNYSIQVASGAFGFTTGEGLVNTFTGSGKVLIQTRNIEALAGAVKPYLASSN